MTLQTAVADKNQPAPWSLRAALALELSGADAFYASPRLRNYRPALPGTAASAVETIPKWPALQCWHQAALQEVRV
ncbi:hypothetical protein B597_003285 [Stutzerimonas stutzeri KOS6]|uniref:Uncharacterized protein n=1 Tax=Stutzerimonas stutzeri KOS6 TaxID=1218352 RepID=A0A061JVS0_STUST|nr:hypothetical protein B597_003285 [Stutzerimonas stutzeri KOS6]